MTTLDFESNEFSGTMPSELGLLSSTLTSMRSGKNLPLSGTLPNQFTHLRHLWSWSCDRNSVSGTLPTQIGEMSFLDGLNLFETHLSGTLPTQIGFARTTTNIDASSSRFSGFIPSELGMLSLNLYLRLPNNSSVAPYPLDSLARAAAGMFQVGVAFGTHGRAHAVSQSPQRHHTVDAE